MHKFLQGSYLAISSRSYNGSIIGVRHDPGLEHIVQMTRWKLQVLTFGCPVPNDDFFVIRSRDKEVTSRVEMYSVYAAFMTTT